MHTPTITPTTPTVADAPPWRRLARWFGHAAAATGRSHLARDLPCQDAALASASPTAALAIVCDGAGSAPHAEHGARAVVQALAAWLPEHLTALAAMTPERAAIDITLRAQQALLGRVNDLGCPPQDLACTLAFVVVKDDLALLGNLGDGIVGAIAKGRGRVVLHPTRGEFANTTVFLTSSRAAHHLQLTTLDARDFDAFVVASDGAAHTLAEGRSGRLAPALTTLGAWCEQHPPDAITDAIRDDLLSRMLARTGDDCALAFIHHARLDPIDLLDRDPAFQRAFLDVHDPRALLNRLCVAALTAQTPHPDDHTLAHELDLRPSTIARHRAALSPRWLPRTPDAPTTHPIHDQAPAPHAEPTPPRHTDTPPTQPPPARSTIRRQLEPPTNPPIDDPTPRRNDEEAPDPRSDPSTPRQPPA